MHGNNYETLYNNYNLFGRWFIIQKHYPTCTCSYCNNKKGFIQFVAPKIKQRNCWWYLGLHVKNSYYIKITGLFITEDK